MQSRAHAYRHNPHRHYLGYGSAIESRDTEQNERAARVPASCHCDAAAFARARRIHPARTNLVKPALAQRDAAAKLAHAPPDACPRAHADQRATASFAPSPARKNFIQKYAQRRQVSRKL